MKIENVVNYDVSFMECLSNILEKGHRKSDRTGVGTTSQFGCAMAFDIRNKGVPLLTLRNTNPQNAIVENLWFLSGNTDIKFLKDNNVGIWDEWVIPETAVFRDYTEDEYFANYKKFYHDKPEYGNGEDPQYGKYVVCTYRDGLNWIRCTEPELYKKFVQQYPKGTDRRELIMFLGGQHGFKLSNKKLVSGSIGSGAYGAQWRNWEDTRLVDPHDITIYLNRGYTEVARTPYDGGKVVVTRKVDQYAKVIELLKNNPDSRRIIVTGWNPGKLEDAALPPCFTEGTLISTPEGYRNIEEIAVGDYVYSATMRPRKVTRVWKTPYKGELIGLKSRYMPHALVSTPEHPHQVYGKGWTKAKDITVGDKLVIPVHTFDGAQPHERLAFKNHGNTTLSKFIHKLTSDDYFTLGYFLGNGWYMENSKSRICFAIPHKKAEEILPKIRKSILISAKPKSGINVTVYETRDQLWGDLVSEFGHGAVNKSIPEWVFTSPIEHIQQFIDGYMQADGHITSTNYEMYTTVSKKLAYGLQRLYGMIGRQLSVRFQKRPTTTVIEGRTVNQNDTYSMQSYLGAALKSTDFEKGCLTSVVREVLTLNTSDEIFVYNLEVEEEHTYIANNIATHNCHLYHQYYTRELTYDELTKRINGAGYSFPNGIHLDGLKQICQENNIPTRALSILVLCRSQDSILGTPSNIFQYSVIAHMVAQVVGMEAEQLIWIGADTHVYDNHHKGFAEMVERFKDGKLAIQTARIEMNPAVKNIDDFCVNDIRLVDYLHRKEPLVFPIAV